MSIPRLDRHSSIAMRQDAVALSPTDLPVDHRPLHVPALEEVAKAIESGISTNYEKVKVTVVECPDLEAKYNIASPGLCGKPRLLDVGGVPNLVPLPKLEKLYDMKDFPEMCDMFKSGGDECLIVGAGAAPYTFLDRNAEMMINVKFGKDSKVREQKTTVSRTFDADGSHQLITLPQEETKISLLGNLFLSEGKPGKVLKISAKKRTGDQNFVSCIRQSLIKVIHRVPKGFPGQPVGLGGVFSVSKGKVKTHVMPKFSKVPLKTDQDVANWLKFYEMDAPFTCLSFLLSEDPGLDIRVEHSHGFNLDKVEGGHYHTDTSPDNVEYVGYYNVAEYIYRIDQPKETHNVGRD